MALKPFFPIAVLILAVDQLAKYFVRTFMVAGQSIGIIDGVFHLTYLQNSGAVFGLFSGAGLRWFFVVFGFFVILLIVLCQKTMPKKPYQQVICALLVGGSAGNLVDRLFLGYIVDFFDFRTWPVFNIADAALTVGIVMLLIWFLRKK